MKSIQTQSDTRGDQDFLSAMQLATGSVLSMAVQVAAELNVFEIIAKAGPEAKLTPTDITSRLPTHNPDAPAILDRVLRLLASHSVLTAITVERTDGTVERLYGLTPLSRFFASNEDEVSLSPVLLLMQDKVFMPSWYHLKDAILYGGVPFNRAHGMHAFEYPETDPRFNQVFNRALFNHTTLVMKKILETYRGFEDLKVVVDVGGGVGTAISMITSKYPTIKGINFDLPHVFGHASPFPGVNHVGGNMFESVPDGDAMFLKGVLHDWDDEYCLKLLKNCYNALPENGKVIVVEGILHVDVGSDNAAKGLCQMDLLMFAQTPSGKERTENEYDTLANEAGFARVETVCCAYNFWVMEFFKN